MVLKRKTVQELRVLLDNLSKGTYVKKSLVVSKKSRQARRQEFLLFFRLKPIAKKYFFFFFKFNINLINIKSLKIFVRRYKKKNTIMRIKFLKQLYFQYSFILLKNIFKYIDIEEIFTINYAKLYRFFLLKYLNFESKLLFPHIFSYINDFSRPFNHMLGSKLFYRNLFFFSKKGLFSFRQFFDVLVVKHNFFNAFKNLNKDYNLYECFISLSRNNIFLVFFRLIDGKVIYTMSTGMLGFNGKKKKTPLAADSMARKFAEVVISRLNAAKITTEDLNINLSLFGSISSLIVKETCKGLYKGGLRFNKIIDKVSVEHSSGLTRKKPRRV